MKLVIYLYLSIYESNHIQIYLSIQTYIHTIYLSVCVPMYPHLYINYLSIQENLPICPSAHLFFYTHLSSRWIDTRVIR